MSRFSFYQVYPDQSSEAFAALRNFATQNSIVAIGIDTHFYPPCLYDKKRNLINQFKFIVDYTWSYFKWYVSCIRNRTWVLPIAFLCNIADLIHPLFGNARLPEDCFADYFQANRSSRFSCEFMATYCRYIAAGDEEYGLLPYHRPTIKRFVVRIRIYKFLLNLLCMFRPEFYVAWQTTYLQSYMPCEVAIKNGIKVAFLGLSGQRTNRIENSFVPREWDWPSNCTSIELHESGVLDVNRVLASKQLATRLKGVSNDPHLFYMPVQPYSSNLRINSDVLQILNTGNYNLIESLSQLPASGYVAVFMHDFSDNHFNGVLPSFASSYYEWLKITIDILQSSDIPFVIKAHPVFLFRAITERSSRALNDLNRLCRYFQSPLPLLGNIDTSKLLDNGLKLGCTVRGTIATELVHMGCPVVCAGHPPYENFLPSRITPNLDEYKAALVKFDDQPPITFDEKNAIYDYLAATSSI